MSYSADPLLDAQRHTDSEHAYSSAYEQAERFELRERCDEALCDMLAGIDVERRPSAAQPSLKELLNIIINKQDADCQELRKRISEHPLIADTCRAVAMECA